MSMQVADIPEVGPDAGRKDSYKGLDLIRHAPCGAEILNVDLTQPLGDELFDAIMEVWHQARVIVFRDQKLEPDDQLRFGRRVGELSIIHTEEFAGEDPAIMYISNVKEDGEFVHALPVGEMMFHIDQCYTPNPAKATILYAIELPKTGGNTLFADMVAAYEALDGELQGRIEGLKALNVYDYDAGATHTASDVSPDAPRHVHPIARTHPVTGQKALFVNRLMTRSVVGLPEAESRELLEALFDHQENPAFVYEHRWRLGDLLMWDNRCTLHARRDFNAEETRLMRRLTVLGETPA
jgi:taurine dioxygenase